MIGVRFLVTSQTLGGAELYTLRLAHACGLSVDTTIVGAPGSPVFETAAREGLRVQELEIGSKLGRRTVAANMRRYRQSRMCLHGEIIRSAADGCWTVLQFKWEELLWGGEVASDWVCLLEHGPIPHALLRIPWARRRVARTFSEAAVVCAVSDAAEASIESLVGRAALRLGAGVARESIDRALAVAPGLQHLRPPGALLIAYAGRLVPAKGVRDLVELAVAFPDVSIVIVGDGHARAELESLVVAASVSDRVHFAGFVADALPYLAVADATVLLTTEAGEGRPLVALESLAVGTPVVGLSSSGALRALAAEFGAETVALVDSAQPAVVRRGIDRIIVSSRGRSAPVSSWESVSRKLLDALEQHTVSGRRHVAA